METVLGHRYRLGDRIGTGGSAQVFEAHDERLDRRVAVKVLDEAAASTADPALKRRFDSEARTAARFVHPNAVTIFDAGTDSGSLYLVMELVTGGSLAQRLGERGPLTPEEAALLGRQVASALAAAHTAGIIHRDVKPANVLLDGDGNAKLADFGIARRFDEIAESLTSTGMVMGTRTYVSSEQAYGQPLGPATDIFSLGITLYEAVTGVRPPSAVERAPDHRLDVRDVDPSIGTELAEVIAVATAMPVDERFSSASEMADALGMSTNSSRPAFASGAAVLAGNTEIMPEHLRPDGEPADMVTTPMTSAALPSVTGDAPRLSDRLADERHQRQQALRIAGSIAAVVLLLGGGAFVLGRAGDPQLDTTRSDPNVAIALAVDTTAVDATVAPTNLVDTTAPPTTVATTIAPTTLPPTTVPPPTTPPPPTEIIAGFPIPVDADQFLETLESNPELAGARGEELARDFDRVLRERPNRVEERAGELRDRIDDWVQNDEIDPAIAGVAIVFLDELIATNDTPGRDPDDDDD